MQLNTELTYFYTTLYFIMQVQERDKVQIMFVILF